MAELKFPTGKIVKSAADLATHDAAEITNNLIAKNFSGYIAVTIRHKNEFQECYAALAGGRITCASYYNYKTASYVTGNAALARIENALAGNGVFDIVELNAEQVNAAVELSGMEKINARFLRKVENYQENYEEQLNTNQETRQKDEKQELLKKYGLTSLLNGE